MPVFSTEVSYTQPDGLTDINVSVYHPGRGRVTIAVVGFTWTQTQGTIFWQHNCMPWEELDVYQRDHEEAIFEAARAYARRLGY